MTPLSSALPTGLHSEPMPVDEAGTAREPGEQSAPGVCEGCRDGHMRLPDKSGMWRHYRVSDRNPKGEMLGECRNPPTIEIRPTAVSARRTHSECIDKLSRMARTRSASEALSDARRTFADLSQPADREDE